MKAEGIGGEREGDVTDNFNKQSIECPFKRILCHLAHSRSTPCLSQVRSSNEGLICRTKSKPI
jgi:hypothetical protein